MLDMFMSDDYYGLVVGSEGRETRCSMNLCLGFEGYDVTNDE